MLAIEKKVIEREPMPVLTSVGVRNGALAQENSGECSTRPGEVTGHSLHKDSARACWRQGGRQVLPSPTHIPKLNLTLPHTLFQVCGIKQTAISCIFHQLFQLGDWKGHLCLPVSVTLRVIVNGFFCLSFYREL